MCFPRVTHACATHGDVKLASPFLTKRRAGWYFRIRVPADLIHIFGSHLTKSLETRDHLTARQRAVAAAARVMAHWDEVRRTMSARWKGKEIGELLPADMVGADRKELASFEAALTPEDRARFRNRLSLLLHAEQRELIEYQADVSTLKTVVHAMELNRLRGEVEGLKGAVAVLGAGGRAPHQAPAEIVSPAGSVTDAQPYLDSRDQRPWNDFVEKFFTDRPSIGTSSAQSHRQAFRSLESILGQKTVSAVTKADIKSYADMLRDRPINRAGRTQMSRDTIIKMLSHVRGYFGWAVEAGIIAENPADGVRPRTATREERDNENGRQAFDRKQLETLFDSPLFTGCLSESRRSEPGDVMLRDERFWFFIVGLLTGGRVEELSEAPAALADLDGIACLDLRLRDVTMKTVNAPRLVPILPELEQLGFLEFAKAKEREGKLFRGGSSFEDWSKGANRYIRSIGISDPAIVFYSLRHNFRQMLNASGLSIETMDKVFGHGKKAGRTVGAGYGRALSGDEARLFVEKVKAQINLTHLYPLRLSS